MPFSLSDLLYGGVVPVLVAGVSCWLVQRSLPRDLGERYAATVAILAGFLTGYALLALAPWTPTAHWHWLPYALLGASVAGPIACAGSVRWFERIFLNIAVATVAGWLLVPTWEDLAPSRPVHVIAVVVCMTALAALLEPLARRMPGPLLPVILWLTMTAAAVVLALSGSLRFAQIGVAAAAACFGIMLVACSRRDTNSIAGIGLPFAVIIVGLLLIGRVNSFSNVPMAAYLLVPAAPLLLWARVVGPFAKVDS